VEGQTWGKEQRVRVAVKGRLQTRIGMGVRGRWRWREQYWEAGAVAAAALAEDLPPGTCVSVRIQDNNRSAGKGARVAVAGPARYLNEAKRVETRQLGPPIHDHCRKLASVILGATRAHVAFALVPNGGFEGHRSNSIGINHRVPQCGVCHIFPTAALGKSASGELQCSIGVPPQLLLTKPCGTISPA